MEIIHEIYNNYQMRINNYINTFFELLSDLFGKEGITIFNFLPYLDKLYSLLPIVKAMTETETMTETVTMTDEFNEIDAETGQTSAKKQRRVSTGNKRQRDRSTTEVEEGKEEKKSKIEPKNLTVPQNASFFTFWTEGGGKFNIKSITDAVRKLIELCARNSNIGTGRLSRGGLKIFEVFTEPELDSLKLLYGNKFEKIRQDYKKTTTDENKISILSRVIELIKEQYAVPAVGATPSMDGGHKKVIGGSHQSLLEEININLLGILSKHADYLFKEIQKIHLEVRRKKEKRRKSIESDTSLMETEDFDDQQESDTSHIEMEDDDDDNDDAAVDDDDDDDEEEEEEDIEEDAVFKIFKLLGDINEELRQEILSLLAVTDTNSKLLEYWDDVQKLISILCLYGEKTTAWTEGESPTRNKIPNIWMGKSEEWELNSIMINPKDPWSTSKPSVFRRKTGFNEQFLIDYRTLRPKPKTLNTSATTFLLLEIIKQCNDGREGFTFLDNFLNIIEKMRRFTNFYLLPEEGGSFTAEDGMEEDGTVDEGDGDGSGHGTADEYGEMEGEEEEEEEMDEAKEGDEVLVLTETGYNLTLSPISPYKDDKNYVGTIKTERKENLKSFKSKIDKLISAKNVLISNYYEKLRKMIGNNRYEVLFNVDNLTKIQIIQLVYLFPFAADLAGVKLDPTLGGSKNKTIKKRRSKNTKKKPKKQIKKQNKTKQTRKNKTRKSKK